MVITTSFLAFISLSFFLFSVCILVDLGTLFFH